MPCCTQASALHQQPCHAMNRSTASHSRPAVARSCHCPPPPQAASAHEAQAGGPACTGLMHRETRISNHTQQPCAHCQDTSQLRHAHSASCGGQKNQLSERHRAALSQHLHTLNQPSGLKAVAAPSPSACHSDWSIQLKASSARPCTTQPRPLSHTAPAAPPLKLLAHYIL
jgi:hypothetical protein